MTRDLFSRLLVVVTFCCVIGLAKGCVQTREDIGSTSTVQPSSARALGSAGSRKAAQVEGPTSIGSASMRNDGTIVLMLRATDGTGAIGDAQIVYSPSHPKYQEVLKHLGGLKPGETKPVPPWPD
jgi:hypothetical protein